MSTETQTIDVCGVRLTVPVSALAILWWDNGHSDAAKRALLTAVSELAVMGSAYATHLAIVGEPAARVVARAVAILEADRREANAAKSRERVAQLELEAQRERARAEAIRAKLARS